jgi:hypothetical protein
MLQIELICDYARHDLAYWEVKRAIQKALQEHGITDADIEKLPVRKFNTTEAAFLVYQTSMTTKRPDPKTTWLFVNVAPRGSKKSAFKNNTGEPLVYAVLKNGVRILAINSGYTLSLVREEIVDLYDVPIEGAQFRSRDRSPDPFAALVAGDLTVLGEKLNPEDIPVLPEGVLLYTDAPFKNLKVNYRVGEGAVAFLKPGDQVWVKIGNIRKKAYVAGGNFEVPEGVLSFSPGSSGCGRNFLEVFWRGEEAATLYQNPEPGAQVEFGLVMPWYAGWNQLRWPWAKTVREAA